MCRHRRRLCHRHAADRAHRASGAGVPGRPRRSPALSKCARNASAATASWCACSTSRHAGLRARRNACASRCARARRPRSAASSRSRRICRRRSPPLRPGGYDFARDLYFQSIGASGYVLGAIKTVPAPHAGGLWLRYAAALDGIREAINQRIHDRAAGRPRLDCLGADHRQAQRDLRRRSATLSTSRASPMCWRSPAITWRWWRASCSSSSAPSSRSSRRWRAATRSRNGRRSARSRPARSISCCPARACRPSAPSS